jgi:hypothetical protein
MAATTVEAITDQHDDMTPEGDGVDPSPSGEEVDPSPSGEEVNPVGVSVGTGVSRPKTTNFQSWSMSITDATGCPPKHEQHASAGVRPLLSLSDGSSGGKPMKPSGQKPLRSKRPQSKLSTDHATSTHGSRSPALSSSIASVQSPSAASPQTLTEINFHISELLFSGRFDGCTTEAVPDGAVNVILRSPREEWTTVRNKFTVSTTKFDPATTDTVERIGSLSGVYSGIARLTAKKVECTEEVSDGRGGAGRSRVYYSLCPDWATIIRSGEYSSHSSAAATAALALTMPKP